MIKQVTLIDFVKKELNPKRLILRITVWFIKIEYHSIVAELRAESGYNVDVMPWKEYLLKQYRKNTK